MNPAEIWLWSTIGLFCYIFTVVVARSVYKDVLKWRQAADTPLIVIWPLVLLFWVFLMWPVIFFIWVVEHSTELAKRKSTKSVEVK